MDAQGEVLATGRVPEGVAGLARLHETVGAHVAEGDEVVIGIELDRGLLVWRLGIRGLRGPRREPTLG